MAAFDGDRMVGYLIGYMLVDQFFGRAIWSRLAGHAVAADVESDLYRDLYAAAAPEWLTWGCFEHLMLVPASPIYLEPWSLLSFGRMHAYGVLPISETAKSSHGTNPDLIIRRALRQDVDHLRAMASITAGHQLSAPSWALTPPESMAERPDQYAGIVDDEEAICWLALKKDETGGEEAVGFQVWYPAEMDADALYIPDQSIELSAAGVHPAWRGRGVTRALTTHALSHAKAEGYRYAITDWRTTNLLSSRTWPRMGFTPVVYRLHRHVDERILWGQLSVGQ